MGRVVGNNNIVIHGDGNVIVKEFLKMQKEVSQASAVMNIINYQIRENHEILKGHNPNCVYLAAFTPEHIELLEKDVLSGLSCTKIPHKLIDMTAKTENEIYEAIIGNKVPKSKINSLVEEQLFNTRQILVIKSLSKSKCTQKEIIYRWLIKILDDAHYKNVHPKTDLVFIDYASFLEKHFSSIGGYLTTNLTGIV